MYRDVIIFIRLFKLENEAENFFQYNIQNQTTTKKKMLMTNLQFIYSLFVRLKEIIDSIKRQATCRNWTVEILDSNRS